MSVPRTPSAPLRAHYIGAPEFFELNQACRTITEAYGWHVYLVGSSLRTRDHRDVDVRCILDDADFDQMFPVSAGDEGEAGAWFRDARWSLLCCSISQWLASRTALKIDFQFQRQTQANALYSQKDGHHRNALGIFLEASQAGGPNA